MTENEMAEKAMSYAMEKCKKPLRELHEIFAGACEVTIVAIMKDMPGALILSAAPRVIPPEELIQKIQETIDGKAGDKMSGYGGKVYE